jgi:hypothetical protein
MRTEKALNDVILYVDLHGHSRKKNIFMYGTHNCAKYEGCETDGRNGATRQAKTRHDTTRRDNARHDTPRQDKDIQDTTTTRHDTTRQDTTRQDTTAQDTTTENKKRQDRTRQDKSTKQDRGDRAGQIQTRPEKKRDGNVKTRQDKTRQDKTRLLGLISHALFCSGTGVTTRSVLALRSPTLNP